MLLFLSIALFAVVLALPALPAMREVARPRDDGRLGIAEQYVRDPRWFGRSFRKMLAPFVAAARGDASYSEDVKLRTDEETRWAPELTIPAQERLRGIAVGEHVRVGQGAGIRDAYALTRLDVERAVVARTLTSDGELHIGEAVRVLRWTDAEGDMMVANDANLGVSASSGARLTLARRVQFERVWGAPVASRTAADDPFVLTDRADVKRIGQDEANAAVSTIAYGPVRILRGTRLPAHLKVHGSLDIEAGVRIEGNVIARGDVTLAADVHVGGHVFSEGNVRLGPGSRVGRTGSVKTVYAAGTVLIANDVEVDGWVVAERGGRTV